MRSVDVRMVNDSYLMLCKFIAARMGDIGKPEKVPMSVIRLNRFNWPRQASLDMAGSARIDELAMSKMMTK